MKGNKRQFHGRDTDDRLKVKNKKSEKKKSKKRDFDPNKPKRPPSPFFIFLDDFRREFNEANPDNKSVGAVGKAAGKKWKSMTEEDKEPFAALARSKKSEYAMNIQQYNMKLANGTKTTGDDDSDQPMSQVNDEKEIASVTSNKESASEEEKEGDDDKEVGPGISV